MLEENDSILEDQIIVANSSEEEVNKAKWKNLPAFVMLNPSEAGIFIDSKSGLALSQFGKYYSNVPKEKDCSRIAHALMNSLLLPCNPKGESTLARAKKIEVTSDEKQKGMTNWDKLMTMNSRELIVFINNTRDASFLTKMRQMEEAKPLKNRRVMVLQTISERLKSRDVVGITMTSQPNLILDRKTGQMVVDNVAIQ